MRLAWFHPGPITPTLDGSDAVDLALELAASHTIDQFDRARAHDFVWQHFRAPYDLTIFELGDTPAHAFMWPYLFHFPGIVTVRAESLQHSRTDTLLVARRHQHLSAERAFSGWNFLRAPLTASRVVVVNDAGVGRELIEAMPGLEVRVIPVGVAAPDASSSQSAGTFVVASAHRDVVERAADRARKGGATVALANPASQLSGHDVVIALEWPPTGAPPVAALRAMAAGVPAVVLETEAVAAWPTLDPQTWQPRGYMRDVTPIAISIDPRDEEHSLMLAMRRLSSDRPLRASLGAAARTWAREHANIETAAAAWESVLKEAARLAPLTGAGDLPAHLTEDGAATARAILRESGATVDFL